MIEMQLAGLKELADRLEALPAEIGRKVLRQSTLKGAQLVRDDARARAAHLRGDLARGIVAKLAPNSNRKTRRPAGFKGMPSDMESVHLVTLTKKAWYGRLVEFGTGPHTIVPKRYRFASRQIPTKGKRRRGAPRPADTGRGPKMLTLIGGRFVHRVQHPGARKKPFLRPAFDENYERVIAVVRDNLARAISRAELRIAKAAKQ